VKEYIDNNKLQIYSDILDILGSKPNFELKTYKTRFRQWEDYVATRLFKSQEDYEQAFFDVAERHEESDGDKNQCCEIEEFFASKISMLGYDPDKDHLWLQVPLLKAWCSEIDIVSKYNDGHIMHMFRKWIRINMFTHIQESNFQLWPTVRGYVRTKGLFWNYAEYAQKQIKKVPCQVHTLGMEYGKEKVIHSI
jgi:hypothetical protein